MHLVQTQKDLIVFSFNQFRSDSPRTSNVLKRLAKNRNIYFFQTPIVGVSEGPTYLIQQDDEHVKVVQPYIPSELSVFEQKDALNEIIHHVFEEEDIQDYSIWTDTPKAMPFIRNLHPEFLIYDRLNDHSIPNPELEAEMMRRAHVVIPSLAIH